MTSTPTIAFLGTGRMGLPVAMNLARAGFPLRVWNRTADRTTPLAAAEARPAATPAETARGADVIVTMLTDGAAVQAVMTGADGALTGRWGDTAPRDHAAGPVWVQMSTVGVTWTERLAADAADWGVTFVDAPVSGSEGPARAGELTILASGPSQVRKTLEPVFAALGRAAVWLGAAGAGTRAKLVLNNWLVDQVEAGTP